MPWKSGIFFKIWNLSYAGYWLFYDKTGLLLYNSKYELINQY